MREPPRPTELEIIAGVMLGPDPGGEALPEPASLRDSFTSVLRRALTREPCLVSFSGGRDSSAILALACEVARRDGLRLPVPAIMRFPGDPASDETSWQTAVLDHLGIVGAEIIEIHAELDALGPAAQEALRRHGILWPGNAYMQRPILELARGGTMLTGVGGDELFSTRAPRRGPWEVAASRLPRSAKERRWRKAQPEQAYGWLTAEGRDLIWRAMAREEMGCPYPWDAALRYWYASRAFSATTGSLKLLGRDHDVEVSHPFLESGVLAALAAAGGRRGFPSRTEAMRRLCGRFLPEEVLSRAGKASFPGAVWGARMREFASGWAGTGVNQDHVDAVALRAEWSRPQPDFRTILLLHTAWLYG